jgi:hypothetical protein
MLGGRISWHLDRAMGEDKLRLKQARRAGMLDGIRNYIYFHKAHKRAI